MPEGLLTDAGVTGGVHDDPDHAPEPSADAPRGWTWQRKDRKWAPRQRGPIVWKADGDERGGAAGGVPDGSAGDLPGGAERDPDPSWLRDEQQQDSASSEKLKWSDIPAEAKDNAASLAGMLGMPLLAFAQAVDPYCGSALASNYENIIDHTLPLILRSKKAVNFFTSKDSDWLLWFGLIQSLWPVATAVFKHHVVRTVEVVRDEQGRPFARPRAAGSEGHGDHLQPEPQPEFNYAA